MESDSTPSPQDIVGLTVERVGNCYDKHDLCCSESILYVLSQAFASGLSGRQAIQLGAGYCHGIGGAGCTCGALTGAVAILSCYLGPYGSDGMKKKAFRACVRELHDQFRQRFRSTCCRILSKKVKGEEQRRVSCLDLTRGGAKIAVSLLLKARPQLVGKVDIAFLQSKELIL